MKTLLLIASLMLNDSDQLEFKKLLTTFNDSKDIKSFYHSSDAKKYTQHLDLDYWGDEHELNDAELLFAFAVEKTPIQFINWKGEAEEKQLEMLLTKQLKLKNINDFNWDFLEQFNKDVKWDQLGKGDYIVDKLVIIDEHLKKRGFRLAFFNPGKVWDGYVTFIVSTEQFKLVKTIRCDELNNECNSLSNIDDDFERT